MADCAFIGGGKVLRLTASIHAGQADAGALMIGDDLDDLAAELARSYSPPSGMQARNGATVMLTNTIRQQRAKGRSDADIAGRLRLDRRYSEEIIVAALAATNSDRIPV